MLANFTQLYFFTHQSVLTNMAMSPQPHDASSVEDVEKKTLSQTQASVDTSMSGDQAGHPEYDRYLDLHRQFEGAGQKTLLRKRTL